MDAKSVEQFCRRVLEFDAYVTGHEENIYIPCPLAPIRHAKGSDSSHGFSIKVIPFAPSYGYCWACGWTGRLTTLVRELIDNGLALESDLQLTKDLESEVDFDAIIDLDVYEPEVDMGKPDSYLDQFAAATEELFPRLSQEMIEKWGVRYDPALDRIVFPVYYDGVLQGCQGRSLRPNPTKKYFNYDKFSKGRFLYGSWIDYNPQRVVVVEGPVDCIVVNALTGEHTVALFGSDPTKTQLTKLEGYGEILIFLDNDKAGQKGLHKLVNHLIDKLPLRVVHYHGLGINDPGELEPQQVIDFVNDAVVVENIKEN